MAEGLRRTLFAAIGYYYASAIVSIDAAEAEYDGYFGLYLPLLSNLCDLLQFCRSGGDSRPRRKGAEERNAALPR